MKVYTLINTETNEVVGTYTVTGKAEKDKELLVDARATMMKRITQLQDLHAVCIKEANYYGNWACNIMHDVSASEVLNILRLKDERLEARKRVAREIDLLANMSDDAILRCFCTQFTWKETELIGD